SCTRQCLKGPRAGLRHRVHAGRRGYWSAPGAPRAPECLSDERPAPRGAATATEGPGQGVSAGGGVSRGRGSSRQRRRRKGRGKASRPGAASRGVGVQAGGDGDGRDRAGHPSRVRRPTGPGFKRAATAKEGPGPSTPAGRGAPRGRGSSRQQRRRKDRGQAPRPGAAPHGAGVQTSGDGGSGPERCSPSGLALPARGRVPYVGFSEGAGRAVRPARLGVGPNDVYPRVVPPGALAPPLRSPRVAKQGSFEGAKGAFRSSVAPSWLPIPLFPAP